MRSLDDEKRKERNKEVVDRFRKEYSHSLLPPEATWFPPRPIIAKDKDAISKLYGIEIPPTKSKLTLVETDP
jgi:hypothetical protein